MLDTWNSLDVSSQVPNRRADKVELQEQKVIKRAVLSSTRVVRMNFFHSENEPFSCFLRIPQPNTEYKMFFFSLKRPPSINKQQQCPPKKTPKNKKKKTKNKNPPTPNENENSTKTQTVNYQNTSLPTTTTKKNPTNLLHMRINRSKLWALMVGVACAYVFCVWGRWQCSEELSVL